MMSMLIIGSGQLGLMMAAEGGRLGIQIDRLDFTRHEILPGTSSLRIPAALDYILSHYDVISAELEHLPQDDFFDAIYQSPAWVNPQAFAVLPDRYTQKQLLDTLNIPTAPWHFIDSDAALAQTRQTLGSALIVKATRGGYDGKGQWSLSADTTVTPPPELYGQLIAETKIPFLGEVSLIGARTRDGKFTFLPLSENVHHQGILRFTLAGNACSETMQTEAESMLTTLMNHLDYVGVMAMECFVTDNGLLVNELAPRVHNSGHWSQQGAECDQFALHIRALLDLPAPTQQQYQPTMMLNLIGCSFNPQWLTISGVACHWYGKETRPGRKVGHLNINVSDHKQLEACASQLRPTLNSEHQQMFNEALAHYANNLHHHSALSCYASTGNP